MATQPSDNNVTPLNTKVNVSIVVVTPETATRWLAHNTSNRPLRQQKVNEYAADMAGGRWSVDASAICFGVNGRLLNGQHRLSAVVQSGMSVPFSVMRNVPPEAMRTMDTGSKRSAADYLHLELGHANSALLAASAKLALLCHDGRIYLDSKRQGTSTAAINDFLTENPDLTHWCTVTNVVRRKIPAPPSAIAVAMWLINDAVQDRESVSAFMDQVAERVNLPAGSPILALDSRLRSIKDHRRRVSHRDYLHLFVKAWNHDRTGGSVRSIALPRPGDQIPKPRR